LGFVSFQWERLNLKMANDPRVDVILPRSVCRLGNWISHGDKKVQNLFDNVSLALLRDLVWQYIDVYLMKPSVLFLLSSSLQ
jgi:hypothetical protein